MPFQNRASGKVVVIKKKKSNISPFQFTTAAPLHRLKNQPATPPGGHVYSVWHAHHLSCLLASGQWSIWAGRKQRCQASSAYDWHKPL
ncbi:hypothetical protein BDV38DRAFT_100041 [Aspergillus pseudotamarii]|uniref:Uncharacterized protein n=1 Tax=Aspergillus pseudotamarii TaxID=132259 RepID=A0A5N6SUI8_ASPPS|nr:uncharacterized protein BDV38DRAFT_100041 [Aspergillus pseudotamarii]KAE8137053.1 hypothetical protein BDV38DRAFT_100041 [Aspergillus pseudotamarii]